MQEFLAMLCSERSKNRRDGESVKTIVSYYLVPGISTPLTATLIPEEPLYLITK